MPIWPAKLQELEMLLLAGGAEEVMAYERVGHCQLLGRLATLLSGMT